MGYFFNIHLGYVKLYTWGTFYPCVDQTHLACLLPKSYFFSFIWPQKPVPFEDPVMSDSWICWCLFLDEWGGFLLKPSQTTCGDVGFYFWVLLTPKTQVISAILHLWSLKSLWLLKLSSSPPLRHASLNIFSCPDVQNGEFQFFSYFLRATFYFVMVNNLLLHIRTHCDGWLRGFGLCVSSYLHSHETKSYGWTISCS